MVENGMTPLIALGSARTFITGSSIRTPRDLFLTWEQGSRSHDSVSAQGNGCIPGRCSHVADTASGERALVQPGCDAARPVSKESDPAGLLRVLVGVRPLDRRIAEPHSRDI
jgi:hypothetical protein